MVNKMLWRSTIPLPGDIFFHDQGCDIVEIVAGPFIGEVGCGVDDCCPGGKWLADYTVRLWSEVASEGTSLGTWSASCLNNRDCIYLGRLDDCQRIDMPKVPA